MVNKFILEELKNGLSEMQFYVMQYYGIELFFIGWLLYNKKNGVYYCLVCDVLLFNFQIKYDFGCGWLSFYELVSVEVICYLIDNLYGMQCIEICCGNCDVYFGYVFLDGLQLIGECYCVNLVLLSFIDE